MRLFVFLFVLMSICSVINAKDFQVELALDTIRTFFEDGSMARQYTVKKGTTNKEGLSLTYHLNGKIAVESVYKDGKLEGVFRSFYENGNIWQTIGYKNGIEDGISTTYFENGKKKSCEVYKNGVLNGLSEEWDERGLVRRKLPFLNGQIHGKAQIYDDLGALKEEMNFVYGIRSGLYLRFEKGIKVMEALFEENRCVKNCNF